MKTRGVRAVLAAAGLVLLTGCGNIHPGIAASVGDEVITRSQLEDAVEGSCLASASFGAPTRQNSQLLSEALSVMVQTELAMQFGEARGATYDRTTINQAMAQFDAGVPREEEYAGFRQAVLDSRVAQLLLVSIGRKQLGSPGGQAPGDDQAYAAGLEAMRKWQARNGIDVDIDPRYSTAEQGEDTSDGSVSQAVSPVARSALNPSSGLSGRLPKSQVCAAKAQSGQ